MKDIFTTGDQKTFKRKVTEADTAQFETGQVHPVYATFALARDAEWTCRLFVLEMKTEDEEGIGTSVSVNHRAPAFVGETVSFIATVKTLSGSSIICNYEARVGDRLIATGDQGQKILKKAKIEQHFRQLQEKRK